MGGRAIGGLSPDLNGIIFKTCKRKGAFLTFVPSRDPKREKREKRQKENWERDIRRARGFQGRGTASESPEDKLFCPQLCEILKKLQIARGTVGIII